MCLFICSDRSKESFASRMKFKRVSEEQELTFGAFRLVVSSSYNFGFEKRLIINLINLDSNFCV
jgi:hypothetical protein